MRHTKKRKDHSPIVYKFWARPCAPLPDDFWSQARSMRELWNALLRYREEFFAQVKELPDAERKARWRDEFRLRCREIVRASNLGWEAEDEVLNRFESASVKAAKSGAQLRPKFGLDKVKIPHRFTGGGLPLERFLRQGTAAKRARIDPVPPSAYRDHSRAAMRERLTNGVFGVNGATFDFEVIVDRQIDERAIVKQVFWCGDFERHRRPDGPGDGRWRWSLQLLCEIPTPQPPRGRDTRPVAGLDLGWRLMAEGSYLRIGMVADSEGHLIELRLPLAHIRKSLRRLRLPEGEHKYYTWWDLIALDERIGTDLQTTKELLLTMVPRGELAGWEKMRERGLQRLLRNWQETGDHAQAQVLLSDWQQRYERLARLRFALWERLKQAQECWYRELAKWLATRYRLIAWEGDLSLKEMAETQHSLLTEAALHHAKKFRGWASLYRLRQDLQLAAKKTFSEILAGPTAGSTITCWQGGEPMERKGGALVIECERHGKIDQDENAARNYLQLARAEISQTSPDSLQTEGLRKHRRGKAAYPIEIPYQLRAVAVPYSVE